MHKSAARCYNCCRHTAALCSDGKRSHYSDSVHKAHYL